MPGRDRSRGTNQDLRSYRAVGTGAQDTLARALVAPRFSRSKSSPPEPERQRGEAERGSLTSRRSAARAAGDAAVCRSGRPRVLVTAQSRTLVDPPMLVVQKITPARDREAIDIFSDIKPCASGGRSVSLVHREDPLSLASSRAARSRANRERASIRAAMILAIVDSLSTM